MTAIIARIGKQHQAERRPISATGLTKADAFRHRKFVLERPQERIGRVGHADPAGQRRMQLIDRQSPQPGLFLGGNAYHGVALNDCTEQAERLATRVARSLE